MSTMTLRRATVYEIEPASSWPMQVRWSQTVEVGGRRRVDSTEYKRIR